MDRRIAGDPVSAFGGVLITNAVIDKAAAEEINKIFFEVIIAPDYDVDALEILGQKKNRIILVRKQAKLPKKQFRALLNGVLVQDKDTNIETVADLKTVTDQAPTPEEVEDMLFANKIVRTASPMLSYWRRQATVGKRCGTDFTCRRTETSD